ASRDPVSLDIQVADDGSTELSDLLVDESQVLTLDAMVQDDLRAQVENMLSIFTPREAEILKKRFGLTEQNEDLTLEQVGRLFDVTRERIRQIEAKAIKKLRNPTTIAGARDLLEQ